MRPSIAAMGLVAVVTALAVSMLSSNAQAPQVCGPVSARVFQVKYFYGSTQTELNAAIDKWKAEPRNTSVVVCSSTYNPTVANYEAFAARGYAVLHFASITYVR